MKRFLLTPALLMTALLAAGCGSGNPIRAEAPGGNKGLSHRVHGDGSYGLYHVTQWNQMGQPVNPKVIVTYKLKSHQRVGFEYVMGPDQQWQPQPQSDVVAFAGSHRIALGPIHSPTEKYYWANVDGWDAYWLAAPERHVMQAATMQ
ncbi:MAG TPA: hypothetical protein VFC78_12580 [Tepidisphaeraceae bacterium]|nr:hypothetical protein [Tepidisphaeraceae bacterium]